MSVRELTLLFKYLNRPARAMDYKITMSSLRSSKILGLSHGPMGGDDEKRQRYEGPWLLHQVLVLDILEISRYVK